MIAGHIVVQIGSFYTGTAMNVMHTLTSHLIFDQHQLHIQLLAEGSGIPHQEVKGSK